MLPNWLKVILVLVGIGVVCYVLNIDPVAVLTKAIHGLQAMHQEMANQHQGAG